MTDANLYHFISRWRVEGTCREVADVLGDSEALARWWPSVYLDVQEVEPPNPRGVGRRAQLLTRGWLPYTIRWEFEVVESRYPRGFTIVARGDFDGRGVWTFEQGGGSVDITYDWWVRAEKPLLRNLSFLMKPLFEANHRWAMSKGETSLRLELERRRASSDASRAAIPPPPGPATHAAAGLIAGTVAIGAGIAYLIVRRRRRVGRDHLARERGEPQRPRRPGPAEAGHHRSQNPSNESL
jgi:hypothetical protein